MEPDGFSYFMIMEYVKDKVGYTKLGGVYVKKLEIGRRLVSNNADACDLIKGLKDGSMLDLYIDTIVDKAIEPVK